MIDNLTYPTIGSQATYIRSNEKGEVFTGAGVVQAIFIDPRRRLMVQIKDGENAYNVDFATINKDKDFEKEYKAAIKEVAKITKEGNELVQKTVSSYNAEVDSVYDKVLGAPIHLDVEEESDKAA